MPYLNHALLVFGGSWDGDDIQNEIWTTSLRLTSGFTSELDWDGVLDQAVNKVQDFVTTLAFPTRCEVEYVKLNPIGPDGRYADPTTTYERFFASPVSGTRTGNLLPLQNTVVVSLLTARSRGIASRGRMFIPGVSVSEIDVQGFLIPLAVTAYLNATASFLTAMGNWVGDYNGVAGVVSQGANGGAGEGVSEPITRVAVGRVVDTQRRRRNALSESPQVLDLGV